MTKEQAKLIIEGLAVLDEMLDRQANGDSSFDEHIKTLTKEWSELVKTSVEETA